MYTPPWTSRMSNAIPSQLQRERMSSVLPHPHSPQSTLGEIRRRKEEMKKRKEKKRRINKERERERKGSKVR